MDLERVPHLRPPTKANLPGFDDPDFVRASTWLAMGAADPDVIVLGAPFGGGSISGARCDMCPAAVRGELARFSVWAGDEGVSVARLAALDAGDVEPDDDVVKTQGRIAEAIAALRAQTEVPIVLIGGDNSVTVGGARGAEADALITFDAHHDCRDPAVRVTNGSPVRQLIEGGLAAVVQIGIQDFANAEPHARWAQEHKVHSLTVGQVHARTMGTVLTGGLRYLGRAQRIWVDVDLDVLARAHVPGAPAALPGGLPPWQLQEAAFALGKDPRVVGMDLTEVDPTADVASATVRAVCAVMLSFLAGVASR